jgi:hypothetical protein
MKSMVRAPAEPKAIDADGIINTDSPRGRRFGFTPDLFEGYLWQKGKRIIISLIISLHEGKGNLRQLFDRIEALGYTIAVPTPSNRMRAICEKRGMVERWEGGCEMMEKPE